MVLRLVLFILEYTVMGFGTAFIVYKAGTVLFSHQLEQWHKKRLGIQHAQRLKEHTAVLCFVCDKETDATKDLYDIRKGWFHQSCYDDLLH